MICFYLGDLANVGLVSVVHVASNLVLDTKHGETEVLALSSQPQ